MIIKQLLDWIRLEKVSVTQLAVQSGHWIHATCLSKQDGLAGRLKNESGKSKGFEFGRTLQDPGSVTY